MAGIIDTIKLAGSLVLAIPAALAGLEFLLVRGEMLTGSVLVGLAVALVVAQQRLSSPTDVKGGAAKRITDAVTTDSDDEE
ncbi:DUF7533 family protein [Natrialba swarupiae]|uniref:Uncharacterized protein n=1 Tax=Natrialba swarupiae TaxID=2448032 RepID=A0A5D5AM41_9EURY|nr:hypothetical protein [Natrialba swarupiae]TYT62776.1 hypothetical protein FYC77_07020 [Natrialba swarupiae]